MNTLSIELWANGNWQKNSNIIYTYDNDDYLTYQLGQTWDSVTNSFFNSNQTFYTNNSSGFPLQWFSQNKSNSGSPWTNSLRRSISYNPNNKPIVEIYEIWTGGSWQNSSRQTKTYDANGYLIYSITEAWDVATNSYKNSSQTQYINNLNGAVMQTTAYNWNSSSNSWLQSIREIFTYDPSATKLQSKITQLWINQTWESLRRETNTYNPNGFLIKILFENWDVATTSFKSSFQSNHQNNSNGTINQVINQIFNEITSSWVNFSRVIYTYNSSLLLFEEMKPTIKVFPNPSTDVINIINIGNSNSDIFILDQNGNFVEKQNFIGTNFSFSISNLPSGLYFIQIISHKSTYSEKFIKQ